MAARTEVPVLIAGGGPVGVTLALDLAWRGVRSIVIERRLDMPPNPKCNTTNARSMEHYRRLGCADAIRRAGLSLDHPTDVVYVTRWTGHELARYPLRSSQQVLDGERETGAIDEYWPTPEPQHRVSQLAMEPALRARARELPACELREGWEFESFTALAEGVDCVVRDRANDAEHVIRCRYLVSCEGAQSQIRRTIGVNLEGRDCITKLCSTYVRAPGLRALWPHEPAWMHRIYNRDAESHIIAIDGKELWLHHAFLGPEGDHEAYDARSAIRDAVGADIEYEVLGQEHWTARALVANRYRDGRVFLCGDAAHIWIPMGGFGMNAGVEDAVNLSWKLAAVLGGWAPDALLDTYEAERRSIGQLVASSAAAIYEKMYTVPVDHPLHEADGAEAEAHRAEVGRLITENNIAEFDSIGMQLGVSYDSSPIVAHDGAVPEPFAIDRYADSSRPGVRAPHVWLAPGRALYDALGPAFTLLRIGPEAPRAERLAKSFEARGVPLAVVDVDVPGALATYEDFPLVLVRPDQHIAWRGQEFPSSPDGLVEKVAGIALGPLEK